MSIYDGACRTLESVGPLAKSAIGLVCIAFLYGCSANQPNDLSFSVDMTDAANAGWFDPAVETVGVRGDTPPLSWGQTLPADDPDGDLVYEVVVPFESRPQAPVVFKFKVDGSDNPNDGWQDGRNRTLDPAVSHTFASRFEDPPDEIPPTFTGNVETHSAFADPDGQLGPRDVFVYLPPRYTESDDRYPVLYLHDGRNVFDASEVGAEWRMDEIAESLIEREVVRPFIIVGVDNTGDRTYEYTPTTMQSVLVFRRVADPGVGTSPARGIGSPADGIAGFVGIYDLEGRMSLTVTTEGTDLFVQPSDRDERSVATPQPGGGFQVAGTGYTLQFHRGDDGVADSLTATQDPDGGGGGQYGRLLVESIKPFIDSTYRTLADREHTAVGGSSLGGLISMHLGVNYPDVFGSLLVVSPSVWWDDGFILREVASLESSTGQRIWLDVGGQEGEDMVRGARDLKNLLEQKGWSDANLKYVEDPDADHSERAWASRAEDMLLFLYGR